MRRGEWGLATPATPATPNKARGPGYIWSNQISSTGTNRLLFHLSFSSLLPEEKKSSLIDAGPKLIFPPSPLPLSLSLSPSLPPPLPPCVLLVALCVAVRLQKRCNQTIQTIQIQHNMRQSIHESQLFYWITPNLKNYNRNNYSRG